MVLAGVVKATPVGVYQVNDLQFGGLIMATERGRAKQDVGRAVNNAQRISERLGWLVESYSDYPDFVLGVEIAMKTAMELEQHIKTLAANVP